MAYPTTGTISGSLLLTGASGFLGQEVARQATGASRSIQPRRWPLIWGTWYSHPISGESDLLRTAQLDIADRDAVLDLVQRVRPRAIIHTAYSKNAGRASLITGMGTQYVAEAAWAVGARLVHVSSDVVFDGEAGPYDETATPAPVHAYGRAKAEAEAAVQRWTPDAATVRTSLICCLDPLDSVSGWVVESLRQARPITLFTDEIRSPVWVQDLAAALLELAGNAFAGVLHVAGPQSLSRYDMGLRLAAHLGLDPAGITPGRSRESGLRRPRNCSLDTSLAQHVLRTRLRSYDEGFVQP